nr:MULTISPECIES: transporter substrate-binding domain-containing protein [unclassified Oleiphilus]
MAFEPAVTKVHHSVLHCGAFRDFEELEAYEIAIIKDFRYPGLNKHASEFSLELTEVKSYEQGLELVDLERVDSFIEMDLRLSYHVSQQPDQKRTTLTYIDDIEPPYAIKLKVNQNMPQSRVNKLKRAYQKLHESGFIQETIEKHT